MEDASWEEQGGMQLHNHLNVILVLVAIVFFVFVQSLLSDLNTELSNIILF